MVKICFLIQMYQNYLAQNLLKAIGHPPSMQKSRLNCAVDILSFKNQIHKITLPVLNLCCSEFIVREKTFTNNKSVFFVFYLLYGIILN